MPSGRSFLSTLSRAAAHVRGAVTARVGGGGSPPRDITTSVGEAIDHVDALGGEPTGAPSGFDLGDATTTPGKAADHLEIVAGESTDAGTELDLGDVGTDVTEIGGHTELERPVRGRVIERVEWEYVRRLTGPLEPGVNSTVVMGDVAGTDLGHVFHNDLTGSLCIVFGDTYGAGSELPPIETKPPDPPRKLLEWRSNVMALIEDPAELVRSGLSTGRMITDRPGYAKQLIPGLHQANDRRGEVTKIPTNGISIDGRLFLHYMSVNWWNPEKAGDWSTNYSSLAYSDHEGNDWHVMAPMWPGDSNFTQVAFVREGSYLYLFGIPAGRFGGVKLARVRADIRSPLDPASYWYLRSAGRNDWLPEEVDAGEIISGPVGELSVMRNDFLRRWIMMYTRPESAHASESIVLREAVSLTGVWSDEIEVCGGGYGSYLHPSLVENRGEVAYFTRSHWIAPESDGHHYNVWLMRVRFFKR
jgi:hypothetical protein